jgi:HSP20 family protein
VTVVDRREARSSVLFPGMVLPAREGASEGAWAPPVDVYRSQRGDEWLVKVDAAGVLPRDVDVRVEGDELVVRGSRRDMSVREGYLVHRMEICYSGFERRVALPCGEGLRGCEMSWGIRDGMVLVFIRIAGGGG